MHYLTHTNKLILSINTKMSFLSFFFFFFIISNFSLRLYQSYKAIEEDNVQLAHHNQSTHCWTCAHGLVHRMCGRSVESCCSRQSGILSHGRLLQVHWCGLGQHGNQHQSGEAAHQSAAALNATVQPPARKKHRKAACRLVYYLTGLDAEIHSTKIGC